MTSKTNLFRSGLCVHGMILTILQQILLGMTAVIIQVFLLKAPGIARGHGLHRNDWFRANSSFPDVLIDMSNVTFLKQIQLCLASGQTQGLGTLASGLRPRALGPGPWALGLGPWALGLGPWALGLGPWALGVRFVLFLTVWRPPPPLLLLVLILLV